MPNDLCFVLMPFGQKPDVSGKIVDFDAVYNDLIAPAIVDAGLEPIRADQEMTGGLIHKPMYERLIFCRFAVADLTTANANVFYELGLRHAVRPWSTVLIFSKGGSQLPFDVAPLRALPYTLTPEGKPGDLEASKAVLVKRLAEAREAAAKDPSMDSPVFQLVDGLRVQDIDHAKTDVFRQQVQYSEDQKKDLAIARGKKSADALRAAEAALGDLSKLESAVIVDLFLAYRSVKAWEDMIRLAEAMPKPLAVTIMVREQLALALNRAGRGEEAEIVLLALIADRGPSSESYGILGRVYKDRWEAVAKEGKTFQARGLLDKALGAYLKGFEADWRDAYPGINAVTLMELKEPRDPRQKDLIPVVTYAVQRKIAAGKPDYWDYATLLELAVLGKNEDDAGKALGDALANVREPWEPETTLRNIRLIRETREKRGEPVDFEKQVEEALAGAGK
jgi:tetratricopeptide (TPR) repeat protein